MHSTNGNVNHYKIMQINSSNSDFKTKIPELTAMIHENKSDIIVISKANSETNDPERMTLREKSFPNFNFEDKLVNGETKARCCIMINRDIKHEKLAKYEDPLNSSIAIRVKDGNSKWLYILGIYRQWKL